MAKLGVGVWDYDFERVKAKKRGWFNYPCAKPLPYGNVEMSLLFV